MQEENVVQMSTKCFLLREHGVAQDVLLAQKQGGEWSGFFDGYGGKVDGNESVERALVREILEEARVLVDIADLKETARVSTYQGGALRFEIHIFTARRWGGIPQASHECGTPRWFSGGFLPLKMRYGDLLWLSRIIRGETFRARLYFCANGSQLEHADFEPAAFR